MGVFEALSKKRKTWNALISLREGSRENGRECPGCGKLLERSVLREKHFICPECHEYLPMRAGERLSLILDEESFRELFSTVRGRNPLRFPGYEKKLAEFRERTGLQEAFLAGTGEIKRVKIAVGVLDGAFFMGSMGSAVGEKIVRLTEYAAEKKLPLILFCASGGARMQEGLFSLMQMAKTAAAVERYKGNGGLYISVLTNPTTGGVSASFASLGDIILAEPGALIGFAGPRVIRQTIGKELPEGFQRAEFQLEHGMIDAIVERSRLRKTLYRLLKLHRY